MNHHDNPYNLFPKNKFIVRLRHMAPGQKIRNGANGKKTLTKKDCHNAKFFSIMTVRPRHCNQHLKGELVVTAKCCDADTPSREKAREVLRMKIQVLAKAAGWI